MGDAKKHDRAVTVKTVWLPLRTVSEMNVRTHWATRAKRTRTARRTAAALCPAASLPCAVTLTRYSAGTLDDDNLRSALKAVRDGIADRLGVDDASPEVEWKYEQAACKRGTYGVSVEIEERA